MRKFQRRKARPTSHPRTPVTLPATLILSTIPATPLMHTRPVIRVMWGFWKKFYSPKDRFPIFHSLLFKKMKLPLGGKGIQFVRTLQRLWAAGRPG